MARGSWWRISDADKPPRGIEAWRMGVITTLPRTQPRLGLNFFACPLPKVAPPCGTTLGFGTKSRWDWDSCAVPVPRKAGACAGPCWEVESCRDARATNGWRVAGDPRRQLEQYFRQPRVVEPQQQQPDEREQQRGVPRRRLLAGEDLRVFSGQATACGQNRGGQVPSATVPRSGTTGHSGGRIRKGFPANQPPLRCGE